MFRSSSFRENLEASAWPPSVVIYSAADECVVCCGPSLDEHVTLVVKKIFNYRFSKYGNEAKEESTEDEKEALETFEDIPVKVEEKHVKIYI